MTRMNRRNNGRWKPDWDRGNGWAVTKDEWQDFHKADDKNVSVEELPDLWCPASGSTIRIAPFEGLEFTLHVGAKEYRESSHRGKKYEYRKPTRFGLNAHGVSFYSIPMPGTSSPHTGGWHEKKSWSAAVKTLLNDIIPVYGDYLHNNPTVPLWPMVPVNESAGLPGLSAEAEGPE